MASHANDTKYGNWTTYLGDNTQFLVFPCLSLKTRKKYEFIFKLFTFTTAEKKAVVGVAQQSKAPK